MLLNNENLSLMWKIDGQTAHFSLAGKTTGYIAIGVNKDNTGAVSFVTHTSFNLLDDPF